jgi:uncharacterized damage-inducible protein DinB
MYEKLVKGAILRHFQETEVLINQLTDESLTQEPVSSGRPLGEIVLHIIRSFEFYSQGLAKNIWKPLTYDLKTYSSAKKLNELFKQVVEKVKDYIDLIQSDSLDDIVTGFNREATKIEILLEMLEHSIQHRGQILVYYRLVGIEPEKIPYIV